MTTVLALTNSRDGRNSTVVVEEIERLGHDVVRMDLDLVSRGEHKLSIDWSAHDGPSVRLRTEEAEHDLRTIGSVWFRRPYEFDFGIEDPVQRAAAEKEFRSILLGLWEILRGKWWVSKASSVARGHLKLHQLALARIAGVRRQLR